MRRSTLLCETLRDDPAEADVPNHKLLVRGCYMRQLASGIYSLLPLGARVAARIEQVLREEMDAIGGQELIMPVVQPAEIWQQTGRWYDIGDDLVRLQDRAEHDLVLAMTHEEVITSLIGYNVHSYRQLPVMLYQIQTKFRDEPRPRAGAIRLREFTMKDAYSAHVSQEDLDRYYPEVYQAYFNVFRRCGLDVMAVDSDVGMMGGTMAHEFMSLTPVGEDTLVLCDACGLSANRQIATFRKDVCDGGAPRPLEEVATPDTKTIAELAALLDVPESSTAKAAFFMGDQGFIFAVVRGDMDVNETKLMNAVKSTAVRPATEGELREAGIVAGYASPIGVRGALVVVDDLVAESTNLVAGANKEGVHLYNVNYGRDYQADIVADITSAYEGAPCPRCGGPVRLERAIEVGNIFKLGTKYTAALKAQYRDEAGEQHPMVMGCYGIGVERLMAAVVEASHDERGIIWPVAVAPYHVYLVVLNQNDETVMQTADELYRDLGQAGVTVLFDDRNESPGVKFTDADLLGMPLRITVSRRTLKNEAVELKLRTDKDFTLVPLSDAITAAQGRIDALQSAIDERVVEEEFAVEAGSQS